MAHKTDSPQVNGSSRADSEWKADPGLSNLVHGSDGSSQDKRSNKDAPLPEYETNREEIASGQGSGRGKGWAGSGKGALNKDTQINQER
ncbi:hypothetical protein V500_05197 [Pseudogymnoascus sp. VKM F-4518 (FW-2643)]|nr:hypothetical protein V500_05197 [Pseudogymnoascus sp. VKM F-4518 (FW-2643)]KFZ16726.1 hypothetical protein V502_04945 [Pseudogymnoascus sp. VKM F-4520 (FW-2644)]